MVAVDPRRGPAAQGSAVLSSARRELGIGIRRLRIRAKSVARRFRRADPALAGRRDFCQRQVGRLSAPESVAELNADWARSPDGLRAETQQKSARPIDRAPFALT